METFLGACRLALFAGTLGVLLVALTVFHVLPTSQGAGSYAMGVVAIALMAYALAAFALRLSESSTKSDSQSSPRFSKRVDDFQNALSDVSEGQAHYHELLNAQPVLISRQSENGNLTYVNTAFCNAFAVSSSEILGQPIQPKVLALAEDETVAAMRTLTSATRIELLETTNGQRWIAWEEYKLRGKTSESQQLLRIGRDVTEANVAATELNKAREAAEAANKAKSRFLAAVSHEIRTPMNGIIGMSSLLLDTKQTPEQQTYTNAITQSSRVLMRLIDELLDFSRIEAGKLALESQPFNISDTIRNAVELMAPHAHQRNLEIAWWVESDVPDELRGDETRVRQILLNLISNAIKFTDSGGVCISANCLDLTNEEASTNQCKLAISVKDTGIGLSPSECAMVFKEFEQTEKALERKESGSGLGLTISQQLAKAMDGEIRVDSTPGKGSKFTAELSFIAPQKPKQQPETVVKFPREKRSLKFEETLQVDLSGLRALLAFDRHIERKAMADVLLSNGASVIECAAQDAVTSVENAHASGSPLNRIIVDSTGDGVLASSALARARELAEPEPVRGVVLVNPVTRAHMDEYRSNGFESYLVRPVRPSALLEQVSKNFPVTEPGEDTSNRAPSENNQLHPHSPIAGKLILLVEDNELNTLLASRLIEKLGGAVITVDNGVAAVDYMRDNLERPNGMPDLILMDILLPKLGGVEAMQKIKEICSKAQTKSHVPSLCPPIVALTANVLPEDKRRYKSAGFDGYLAKPFEPEELENLVRHWLTTPKNASLA